MATPFSDPNLWNHGTFTFTVHSDTVETDSRGNQSSAGKQILITFKMKQAGFGKAQRTESGSELAETYECRVVAVDGNYENFQLPTDIKPGDTGTGTLNKRPCKATIKTVAQSGLSPLLRTILGDNCTLLVDYQIRRGSQT